MTSRGAGSDITRDHVTSRGAGSDITRNHVTMASSLGEGGSVGGACKLVGVVSSSLPLHKTDVHALRDSLQELMSRYSIRGVSGGQRCPD